MLSYLCNFLLIQIVVVFVLFENRIISCYSQTTTNAYRGKYDLGHFQSNCCKYDTERLETKSVCI